MYSAEDRTISTWDDQLGERWDLLGPDQKMVIIKITFLRVKFSPCSFVQKLRCHVNVIPKTYVPENYREALLPSLARKNELVVRRHDSFEDDEPDQLNIPNNNIPDNDIPTTSQLPSDNHTTDQRRKQSQSHTKTSHRKDEEV